MATHEHGSECCGSQGCVEPRAAGDEAIGLPRRGFLLLGLGLLAGCASNKSAGLPEPLWPDQIPKPVPYRPDPEPALSRSAPAASSPALPNGVISRTRWAGGPPAPGLMDRMLPVRYITVHHDGLQGRFNATDDRFVCGRIELIRKSHREKGWGDIGYHFIIDPAGRVWEGRSLQYQGAHVKDRNEHNIGVVVLGNYDNQSLNDRQAAAVRAQVVVLMRQYRVSPKNVYTHQEWKGAHTACPGRSLQKYMRNLRSGGSLA